MSYSKRTGYIPEGQKRGSKRTGKTHKDQRKYRAKAAGTNQGYFDHQRREMRRADDEIRQHKNQQKEWRNRA